MYLAGAGLRRDGPRPHPRPRPRMAPGGAVVLAAGLSAALATVSLVAAPAVALPPAGTPPAAALGSSMADMCLFDVSGHRRALADVQAGRIVVIFWAFWCDTWKKSLPSILALVAERGELGCEVWTVSVDGRFTAEVRPLVEGGRITFPVLLDNGAWTRRLGVRHVPTVFVLDRGRRVVWVHEGYPGNARLKKAIRKVRD